MRRREDQCFFLALAIDGGKLDLDRGSGGPSCLALCISSKQCGFDCFALFAVTHARRAPPARMVLPFSPILLSLLFSDNGAASERLPPLLASVYHGLCTTMRKPDTQSMAPKSTARR